MCGAGPSAYEPRPYVIGRRYPVTEVRSRWNGLVRWFPVAGALHEDAEIIGFTHFHYHVDWRFVSSRLYARMHALCLHRQVDLFEAASVLSTNHDGVFFATNPRNYETRVRRLVCKRERQAYPHHAADWLDPLKQRYAAACLTRGVCPHRGYDLRNEAVVDGVVTCPLHGLRWDVASGRPVPAPPPPPPTPGAFDPIEITL